MNAPCEIEKMVSPDWLADRLGLQVQMIRRYINAGVIPARKYGRLWRIPMSAAERIYREGLPECPAQAINETGEPSTNDSPVTGSDCTGAPGASGGRSRDPARVVLFPSGPQTP